MNYHFSSFGNPLRWLKQAFFDTFTFYKGGGGGGSVPSNTTVTTSNIPTYLKKPTQAMIGGAMSNMFNMDSKGNITSTKPYTPFSSIGQGDYNQAIANAGKTVAGFTDLQNQAFTGAANLQLPGQFGQATDQMNAANAGSMGIAALAPGLANQAQSIGAQGANIGYQGMEQANRVANVAGADARTYGQGAVGTGLQSLGYGADAAGHAGMGYGAGEAYARAATDPNAVGAFMNPYVAQSLAPQLQLLAQQTGMAGAGQQSAATSSGAFGGSRSALANALTTQAGNLAAQQAIGQGYNAAYDKAIQNMQYTGQLGIQGLQAGTQANLAGIAGVDSAMRGYQTGLQGVGQQINAGNLGLAGYNTALAGNQQNMQGLQGQLAANQLGLSAYGQAGNQALGLANIGNMQLAGQEGILGLQSQFGGMQQQQQQNIINQAMADYAKVQNYPMEQYAFLSSLIRGYPMGSTTQQYAPAPSAGSQMAGLGLSAAGLATRMRSGGIVDAALTNAMKG